MKKIMFTALFVLGAMVMTNNSFAQGNGDENGSTNAIARKALADAGCLDDVNGSFTYSTTFLGGCACGPATTCAWLEVLVVPNQNNHIGPYVKLAPIGKVTLCGDEVLSVECY